MCGIAGAVGVIDVPAVEAVRRCSEQLAHRGPDDRGLWTSSPPGAPRPGAVLAHRRLSIIDTSAAGHQPMVDPETGNTVCLNGEIYNFPALRDELLARGYRFASQSDTEVLLKAYACWGTACIGRLRGMFAFAIWDAAERHVFLARDPVGIKPLYCARSDAGVFLFASEVRALLATGLLERRLDPRAVSSYLWNGFVPGPDTIAAGIDNFPAGTWAVVRETGEVSRQRYWSLPAEPREKSGDLRELAGALEEAVAMRLVSDVPLGIFLSGGVDSSAVAALASRASAEPPRTFTIAFEESEFDESRYASAVARALGTEHQEICLRQADFVESLPEALGANDQPTYDAVNTFFISRAVRRAGITVALAGTGGDELFGGYTSFVDIPFARRWTRRMSLVPRPLLRGLVPLVTRLLTGKPGTIPPQTRWGKLGDALACRGDLVKLYQVSYALFSSAFRDQLLTARTANGTSYGVRPEVLQELTREVEASSDLYGISTLEQLMFVRERLLRDTDAASMASALEVRVPILDFRFVELASRLDTAVRFQPDLSKQVLRRIGLRGLPPEIFQRPKSGFVLPFDTWCRSELESEISRTLGDAALCEQAGLHPDAVGRLWRAFLEGAPGLYWSRVWAVFSLLDWCRRNQMGLSP